MNDRRIITIWDSDTLRIAELSRLLALAMRERGVRYDIAIMSEPPLISRMNLGGQLPTFECDGRYWHLRPNESITQAEALQLIDLLDRHQHQEGEA